MLARRYSKNPVQVAEPNNLCQFAKSKRMKTSHDVVIDGIMSSLVEVRKFVFLWVVVVLVVCHDIRSRFPRVCLVYWMVVYIKEQRPTLTFE